ncbi:glycosyltransferase family 2 protein [Spirosoma pulveris]
MTKENVAGVVVLYNSPNSTIDNILTYIDQVKKLYVVDNSSVPNAELVKSLQLYNSIHYHSLNGNKGIATALNWAAKQAIKDDFSALLTMDDDTRTPSSMVQDMLDFWLKYPDPIGIISGIHHNKPVDAPFRKLDYTLTSGNILNLEAYKMIGPFRDDFFIDHVDHDYGLRLNQNGYKVIELPGIRLEHQLGDTNLLIISGYTIGSYGSHSPTRLYYFARNGIYMACKYFFSYPSFSWMVFKELLKRWVKAFLMQKDQRLRTKMLYRGISDGFKGKLGELD